MSEQAGLESSMRRRFVVGLGIVALTLVAFVYTAEDPSSFDRRLPVGSGGALSVDITLGGGFSFDHGSLEIRSHDDDDIRVITDTRGWGKYAVQFDLSHGDARAAVVGRVEGPLHWMFGGPTVDVQVFVPRDVTVDARIDGGPLTLEDLTGPITARVDDTDLALRRARGAVRVESNRGAIEIEDVDGELSVQAGRGRVEIAGVRGSVRVDAERAPVQIESVDGEVRVVGRRGRVEVEEVRGRVDVALTHGRIEAEDVVGPVAARNEGGSIEVEGTRGPVEIHSERGHVEVEFEGAPSGRVFTGRGRIEIEVDDEVGYRLDARTARGRVRLGDSADDHGDSHARTSEGDGDDASAGEDAPDHAENARERGPWGRGEHHVLREVNGGGPTLTLRAERGTIRVRD